MATTGDLRFSVVATFPFDGVSGGYLFFLRWLNHWGMWPYVVYRIGLALVIYRVVLK